MTSAKSGKIHLFRPLDALPPSPEARARLVPGAPLTTCRADVIVAPGRKVRFGVAGSDGRRSANWIIWTSKNSDDVYLASRPLAKYMKVSLHESGSWHHGFISNGVAAEQLPPGSSRHIDRWSRPPDTTPGVKHALRVCIPDECLWLRPNFKAPPSPFVTVPAPGRGYAANIEVLLVEDGVVGTAFQGAILLAQLRLAGGGSAVLLAFRVPWTDADQMGIYKALLAQWPSTLLAERGVTSNEQLRAVVYGANRYGLRVLWETSAPSDRATQALSG